MPPYLPHETPIPAQTEGTANFNAATQSPFKRRCSEIDDPDDKYSIPLDSPQFKSNFAKKLHLQRRNEALDQDTEEMEVHSSHSKSSIASDQLIAATALKTLSPPPKSQQLSLNINKETTKVPPLFMPLVPQIMPILDKLQKIPSIGKFTTKTTANDGLRVQCEDMNIYNAVLTTLEKDGTHLHTHQLRSQKGFRIIMRHLHHSTPCEWIKLKMRELGFIVRYIRNISNRFTGKPLNLFELELQAMSDGNHFKILELNQLCGQLVKVEQQAKPTDPAQCHRCQVYGHTKNYCRRPFRCMKCAGEHPTVACSKPRQLAPRCTNCGGEHISSYKGCPSFKAARSKLSSVRAIAEVKRLKQKRIAEAKPPVGQRSTVAVANRLPQHPGQTPVLSYSRVVRSGLDVHSREPIKNQQPKVQHNQQHMSQQEQHQQQQRNKTTQAVVSSPDNDMQNTAPPVNPVKAPHISIRPQLVLGKPQHKRPANVNATKKATTNSRLPKVEASGGSNRGLLSNPAEKHLACFQNRLREEQQRNQQQQPQHRVEPDYPILFSKLENKIDQLINVMMRFIELQTANSMLPAQLHQQQNLLQQALKQRNASNIAPMELGTANDIPNDD